jgi:hypothetical protein
MKTEAKKTEAKKTEAGPYKVESIDISTWKEFGTFFNRPVARSTVYTEYERDPLHLDYPYSDYVRVVYSCCFVSAAASTKAKAVKALRADLLKAVKAGAVSIAFLARPATLKLSKSLKLPEILKLPKGKVAAFCFLFGYFDNDGDRLELVPQLDIFVHKNSFNIKNWNSASKGSTPEGGVYGMKEDT